MNDVLELISITKQYGGITALSNVNLSVEKGKVHSIVGENGAGKSTLIKIITGATAPSCGTIYVHGKEISLMTPAKSKDLGIAGVYQELNLIPQLKVYQNIFYGKDLHYHTFLQESAMKEKTDEVLRSLHVNFTGETLVEQLGMGSRQMVEVAKALMDQPQIILFDEPTASLPISEAKQVHRIIRNLADKGIAVLFVSHKLDEVLLISDTISVMRDGNLIHTYHKEESWAGICDISTLVDDMLGQSISTGSIQTFSSENKEPALLELRNVSTDKIHNISFSLYPGEIVSLSGMLGSMRTELLSALFSLAPIRAGTLLLRGQPISPSSPGQAMKLGFGFVSEDRKDSGLFMQRSIRENMTICCLNQFRRFFSIHKRQEEIAITTMLKRLRVKYASLDQKVSELSGGNQQKIAIGKCLMANPDILLIDEPTRGVDIGAKEEIYTIIGNLASAGKSILLVSSEMEELIHLSHRTFVLNNGRIVSEYPRGHITSEKILADSSKFRRLDNPC